MRLGFPTTTDIIEGINEERITNLTITRADLETATKIWGRDLGSMVGKSIKTPESVVIERYEEADKTIVLSVDIFYIGGLMLLQSVSRRLNMFMVSYLNRRTVTV